MDFKNLYSLFSSPWFINERAYNSLLPVLLNILERGEIRTEKEDLFFSQYSASGKSVRGLSPNIGEEEPENSVVAVLPISGTIMKHSGWCAYGTQYYMKVLEQWKKNEAVAGVVLDFDSGGGSVSGTPEFAEYIENYCKPIVSFTNGMMCSAAYYLAAGAKKILATNFIDVVGSIGTMYRSLDFTGKYEKEGIKVIEVYATPSVNKNGPIRAAQDKENPTTARIVEEILNPMNNRFTDFIKRNRASISEEALTGKEYFTSEEVLKNGLIDQIGTLEEAVQVVFDLRKEQTNNSNNTNMSEKNYPKIAAVLGMEVALKSGFFLGNKTVSISEDQLDKLEASLQEDQASQIEQLQEDKKQLSVKAESLESVKAAVVKSLADNNLQSTGTEEGDIQLLSAKVTEYGGKNGAKSTNVHSEGDSVETELSAEEKLLNQSPIEH